MLNNHLKSIILPGLILLLTMLAVIFGAQALRDDLLYSYISDQKENAQPFYLEGLFFDLEPGLIEQYSLKVRPQVNANVATIRMEFPGARVLDFQAGSNLLAFGACESGDTFVDNRICVDIAKEEGDFDWGQELGSISLEFVNVNEFRVIASSENGIYDGKKLNIYMAESLSYDSLAQRLPAPSNSSDLEFSLSSYPLLIVIIILLAISLLAGSIHYLVKKIIGPQKRLSALLVFMEILIIMVTSIFIAQFLHDNLLQVETGEAIPAPMVPIDCGALDVDGNKSLNYVDLADFVRKYSKQCLTGSASGLSCGPKDSDSNGTINYVDLYTLSTNYAPRVGDCSHLEVSVTLKPSLTPSPKITVTPTSTIKPTYTVTPTISKTYTPTPTIPDHGLPEAMPIYYGSGVSGRDKCLSIIKDIATKDPLMKQYFTSQDLVTLYFESGGGYSQPCRSPRNGGQCISCCKPVDGIRWDPGWVELCASRPIWTNMLMRHELTHVMARANWNYFTGTALLYEFAADAMSNNGGCYKFQMHGSTQYEYATTIKKRIIENWRDYFDVKAGSQMSDTEFKDLFQKFLSGDLGNTTNAKATLANTLEVGGNFPRYMAENIIKSYKFVGCNYPGMD